MTPLTAMSVQCKQRTAWARGVGQKMRNNKNEQTD